MPLAPGENVRLRRQDVYEKSRQGLTWLAVSSAFMSMVVVWFVVELAKQGGAAGDPQANLIVTTWLNILAFGMAALSSAAVVGAVAMRAQRDATAIG
jgi:hypothetical protein